MISAMRLFHHSIVLVLVVAFLGGCMVTMPDGTKVSKEYFRAKSAQDLMILATAADREYDQRNPIEPPPEFCDGPQSDAQTAAICVMATSTYNAQLQVREDRRKAHAAYATAVLDRQADERERWKDRAFNLFGLIYQTERTASRQASAGTSIRINGHRVSGGVRGGSAGRGGEGTGGAEIAGAGGHGGSGGGSSGHTVGDQNVTVVVGDNNQSGSGAGTYSPILEYATDLAQTRPIFDNGAQDNRSSSDDDTVGLSELF